MNSNDYNYENWKTEAKEFWEKAKKNIECGEDEVIKECVCLAFRDLTVRTMKSREDVDKPIVLDELARECCEEKKKEKNYLTLIQDWIEGCEEPTEEKFLDLHDELCEIVKQCLKKKYKDYSCTDGKAQKIVNMTFKYLYAYYCANSSESKNEKLFKYCHMPLDSFTLEWFRREITHVAKSKIGSWSNMDKKGDEKSYGYEFYHEEIKKYFEAQKVTPLQAEFVIWPHIQKELATEVFIFTFEQIDEVDERRKIRGDSLNKKITRVKEIVKKM